jgi:hypothetical protein
MASFMKTTIDLPDAILERAKIAAVRRRTTIKNLVIEGLEAVLREEAAPAPPTDVPPGSFSPAPGRQLKGGTSASADRAASSAP